MKITLDSGYYLNGVRGDSPDALAFCSRVFFFSFRSVSFLFLRRNKKRKEMGQKKIYNMLWFRNLLRVAHYCLFSDILICSLITSTSFFIAFIL